MKSRLQAYFQAQSSSLARHALEEMFMLLAGWVPGAVGIALRAPLWKLLVKGSGMAAIEKGVVIKHSKWVTLGDGVFLDRGVYLHGGQGGLKIGEGARVMFGAEINVYNFRDLKESFIDLGKDCVIGPGCVLTGQGGLKLGDDVIIGPRVLILPVDHNYENPGELIREQGLKLKGVSIDNNVWIGGGAIILGGVKIGEGSVVAAGAVVNDTVPPRSLVAGNPAKVIKQF